MATRNVVPPKRALSSNLRFLARPLNSVPSSITTAVPAQFAGFEGKHTAAKPSPPPIDLADPERLFSSVPTTKLIRSVANLHAAAVGPVVDLGIRVMRSRMIMGTGLAREAVLGAVRRTFYEHFCGGEDTVEAAATVRRLNEAGLRGMLDYAVEDAEDNPSCDRNLDAFLQTVESTKTLPQGHVSSPSPPSYSSQPCSISSPLQISVDSSIIDLLIIHLIFPFISHFPLRFPLGFLLNLFFN